MKQTGKLFLSILLVVLLFTQPLCLSLAAEENGMRTPTVYIVGQGYELVDNAGNTIYNITATLPSDTYIQDQAKKLVPLLAAGILTQRFERFSSALLEALEPVYAPLRPNKDGTVTDGSHAAWTYSEESLAAVLPDANGEYALDAFQMYWDWRLDPVEVAGQLDAYIDAVLAATGASKINLVSRCLGSSVALSYVTLYGTEKIRGLFFFSPTCFGNTFCGQIFAGKLNLDPSAIERYVSESFSGFGDGMLSEPVTVALLRETVRLLVETHQLDLHAVITKHNFEKIKALVYGDALLASYGSFASYWSMVDEENYAAARRLAFAGKEAEYAAFLQKIDFYHYEIQQKLPQTLRALQKQGLPIGNLSKYGFQMIPLLEDSSRVGDEMLDLYASGFGITTPPGGAALSQTYCDRLAAAGKQAYLSPDFLADVSTAVLPDTTWVVKDLPHRLFPASCDRLMAAFLRSGSLTADTDPAYPRFLKYDAQTDTLLPLTADNAAADPQPHGALAAIRAFLQALGAFLRHYIQQMLIKSFPS